MILHITRYIDSEGIKDENYNTAADWFFIDSAFTGCEFLSFSCRISENGKR
jgi:hypothetical protein